METNTDIFGALARTEQDILKVGRHIYLQVFFTDGTIGLFDRKTVGRDSKASSLVVTTNTPSETFPLPEGMDARCLPAAHRIDVSRDVAAVRYIASETPLPPERLGWRSAGGARHIPGQ